MPKIELSRQARDFLLDLPSKQARQIAEKLQALAVDPFALPSEALKGYQPMRRLKSGEFRIIFAVEPEIVQICLIGKRNDDEVYKALERAWKK